MIIKSYKTQEAAEILQMNRHTFKTLRETGLLTGRKIGNGWVFDEEELNEFTRSARGYDLSNDSKIRFYAPMILLSRKK